MPIFEIQGPDGEIYEVDAPDENSAVSAFGKYSTEAPSQERNSVLGKMDSVVRGAADTLSLGFADEIAAGLGTGFGYLGDYEKELARQRGIDKSDAQERFGYRLGGQLGGALTGGAGLVKAGLSPTASAVQAGYRLPAVAGTSAVEGAALGGAGGFGSGEGLKDRLDKAKSGALWGGGIGLAAPLAVAGIQKAISPFRAGSDRQAAAAILEREGVPLSAGQKTGSKWLQYRESELGGAKAADLMEDQAKAFTDAAMRRAGGSGLADPDNLASLKSTIGKGFDDISARNTLQADKRFVDDIRKTADRYGKLLEVQQKPIVQGIIDDLSTRMTASGGKLSGQEYQTIRSDLTRAAQSTNNQTLSQAFKGIRNALDDAMDRSINPGDTGKWRSLRNQYGNYKVLENASLGGGEAAGFGIISPARLRQAAASGNRSGFATGQSDFTELAKAGQALMSPLPNSGTAQRIASQGIAAALLGGGGSAVAGPWGFAAGLAGPAIAGKALMSRPVQGYLANQVGSQIAPGTIGLLNELLLQSGSAAAGRLAP